MAAGPTPITSPVLDTLPGVRHAFFTREGGVSTGIYASLNTGLGSDDAPQAVAENRARCAGWFGREPQALLTGWQVHSATPLTVDRPWGAERPRGGTRWSRPRRAWSARRSQPTARRCCWPIRRRG